MDPMELLLMGSGLLTFLGLVALMIAGVARLRGRRSRFDVIANGYARATSMSVYPASLRGTPEIVPPPAEIQEQAEPR